MIVPIVPIVPKTDLLIEADLKPDTELAPPSQCLACKRPTGLGYSSYYEGKFCSYCGPKLSIVKAAWKAHPEYSISELWEDLAARGRPPKKEHLPLMIEYLKAEAA